jgi:hypothetical protein
MSHPDAERWDAVLRWHDDLDYLPNRERATLEAEIRRLRHALLGIQTGLEGARSWEQLRAEARRACEQAEAALAPLRPR